MFLGTTCNHPDCNLNDFLPFACPACHLPFCQPHFLPSVHQCKSPLPPSMVDRIAPQCPMCNEVVPYPPGGRLDPNEAVERHIAGGCEAMEGGAARKKAVLRQKKAQGKVCFKRGCSKSLIVEMRCVDCGRNFCPSHRHGKEHDCKGVAAAGSGNTRPGSKTAGSRLLNMGSLGSKLPSVGSNSTPGVKTNAASSKSTGVKTPTVPVTQAAGEALDARAAAAAAALKRAGGNVKVPFVKTKTEKCVPPPRA